MIDQEDLKPFQKIYDETYNHVLSYIICKCKNLDDVNDILQETYIEVFKKIQKGTFDYNNSVSLIIGISKNKIKKHYFFVQKFNIISIFSEDDNNIALVEKIKDDFELEDSIINKMTLEQIWNYLQSKKIIVSKIFYMYYSLGLTIKEISEKLNINESKVKNHLYRTINEMKTYFRKDEFNEK